MTYKTPGVYVVEKSIFPPSVAQVETAIPAFIGYTEKADDKTADDLLRKPKKISSLLDYRQYFGGSPPLNITGVKIGSDNSLQEAAVQPQYYMYDSLQLFFMNGGGNCYIISVGHYNGPVAFSDMDAGLDELAKKDEPTIIVFPDAVLLPLSGGISKIYDLQKNALSQCNKLMDRVAVFDLLESDSLGTEFRNQIGTNFLKYGAAYSPHLKTSLDKEIKYRQIRSVITRGGVSLSISDLTTDTEILEIIANLDNAANDVETIDTLITGFLGDFFGTSPLTLASNEWPASIEKGFQLLRDRLNESNSHERFGNILDYLYRIAVLFDDLLFTTPLASADMITFMTAVFNDSFQEAIRNLIALDRGAESLGGTWTGKYNKYVAYQGAPFQEADWGNPGEMFHADETDETSIPVADITAFGVGNITEMRFNALTGLYNIFTRLNAAIVAIQTEAANNEENYETSLYQQFPAYKNLIEALNGALSTIPPSGAIAGIYAQVDANRGVWKAPANVSLNGVSDLTDHFTQTETDDLNVDTNFGKSINAIKYFTGMGFMVWGARTLAGNDNEWRYISVRRFFNMVEESCKKSTMWAVFEPNDAGTWIKVKGMIENFLTLQWRNGALQGAKPEEAFFVKVGLGETMTSVDILEGRMIVEIGMAVVRPAEFIILTFSHKMVES